MHGEWDGFAMPEDIKEVLKSDQTTDTAACIAPEANHKVGFFRFGV